LKKILLVEDDVDTLELVELVLQNNGYAVIKAKREVSLEEIIGIKPDLALLDFMLPFGLGTDLCLSIKKNPFTSDIPVILYSASSNLKFLAESCQADAYLEKPFDLEELIILTSRLIR
jgi:two-component system phosphate regulon response regulator PhoB